jgi:predicted O-methyltransferase YrrM
MKRLRIICKYIQHFLSARNTGGYGVHSPFMFQFTRYVLCEKHSYYIFAIIENLRERLKKDNKRLDVTDLGTGLNRRRTVADIAKHSLKSKKQSQLFFRIANFIKARSILELGTSLGITTSYLASTSSRLKCITLEGCPEIAKVARENFDKLGLKNIEMVVGNIDITLEHVLKQTDQLDFIFIDANHRSEAVMDYFEQCLSKVQNHSILVLDDIYWSADMENAWQAIKNHPRVASTIDLFHMGIVFFNKDIYKKHYIMRY